MHCWWEYKLLQTLENTECSTTTQRHIDVSHKPNVKAIKSQTEKSMY